MSNISDSSFLHRKLLLIDKMDGIKGYGSNSNSNSLHSTNAGSSFIQSWFDKLEDDMIDEEFIFSKHHNVGYPSTSQSNNSNNNNGNDSIHNISRNPAPRTQRPSGPIMAAATTAAGGDLVNDVSTQSGAWNDNNNNHNMDSSLSDAARYVDGQRQPIRIGHRERFQDESPLELLNFLEAAEEAGVNGNGYGKSIDVKSLDRIHKKGIYKWDDYGLEMFLVPPLSISSQMNKNTLTDQQNKDNFGNDMDESESHLEQDDDGDDEDQQQDDEDE